MFKIKILIINQNLAKNTTLHSKVFIIILYKKKYCELINSLFEILLLILKLY